MRPVNFVDPARYEPSVYLTSAELLKRSSGLNWVQRCAFAELLAGNMKTHILYAVRDDNKTNSLATPDGADTIPVMRDDDGQSLGAQIKPGMSLKVDMAGVNISLPLPQLAGPILMLIDGKKSLADIHADLQSSQKPAPGWDKFKEQFDQLFSSFFGLSRMFLKQPSK